MTIAVLMMCDNRPGYTSDSIASLVDRMPAGRFKLFLHDDSCDPSFNSWLRETVEVFWPNDYEVLTAPERRGFGGAIQAAWSHIYDQGDVDFLFHTENDFTYNRPIELGNMQALLEREPKLAQVALLRQSWSPEEKRAGGVLHRWPVGTFTEQRIDHVRFLTHRAFWTTNPSLIPAWILGLGWPDGAQSEGMFTEKLRALGLQFAYLGRFDDQPRVDHIGFDRVGGNY